MIFLIFIGCVSVQFLLGNLSGKHLTNRISLILCIGTFLINNSMTDTCIKSDTNIDIKIDKCSEIEICPTTHYKPSIITRTFDKKIGSVELNKSKDIDENKEIAKFHIKFVDQKGYSDEIIARLLKRLDMILPYTYGVHEIEFRADHYWFKLDYKGNIYETFQLNEEGELYRNRNYKIV